MQIGIDLEHHDHAYVERRGGHVLWSYCREAPARCAFRRASLDRAVSLYETDDVDDDERGGMGLLVLQRALLATEDLARLLHVFRGTPSWQRFVVVPTRELDTALAEVFTNPAGALEPFALPDPRTLAAEPLSREERVALGELVKRTAWRWHYGLETAGRFWLDYRRVAKSTMHGFPLIPGRLINEAPGAGALSDCARDPGRRPWALAVLSERDFQRAEINTECHPVALDPASVRATYRSGKVAIKLSLALAAAQAGSIETGHRWVVPFDLLERLPDDQQAAIRAAHARVSDDQEDAGRG